MVVGGLPEKNPVHAECVANQALDMMYYCKQVVRPDSDEPIQVSNIHSGCSISILNCIEILNIPVLIHLVKTYYHSNYLIVYSLAQAIIS